MISNIEKVIKFHGSSHHQPGSYSIDLPGEDHHDSLHGKKRHVTVRAKTS